jgi:hypothetical protein
MKQFLVKWAKKLIALSPLLAFSGFLSCTFFFGEAEVPKNMLKD